MMRETRPSTIFRILKLFLIGIGTSVLLMLVLILVLYLVLPDGSEYKRKNPKMTAVMRQRLKEAVKKGGRKPRIRYIFVPLSRISPHLKKAVIISEDASFYQHHGFDLRAIKLAVEKNLKAGRFAYGGSTITQQLARNLYLSTHKSLWRKLKEIIIAYKMENVLTKNRILELYLNVAEWGHMVFGAEAASRHYYRKHASQLSLDEAVRLAVILPSPLKHSPYDGSRFVRRRRARVLYWMYRMRYISREQYLRMTGRGRAVERQPEKPESTTSKARPDSTVPQTVSADTSNRSERQNMENDSGTVLRDTADTASK